MPFQVQVTQDDINGLSKKLDDFAEVLTPREKMIFLGVLGMAGKSIHQLIQPSTPPTTTPDTTALPKLSTGFLTAFENGAGTKFNINDKGEAETFGIKISGDWSRGSAT
jgi:hypothetical protein